MNDSTVVDRTPKSVHRQTNIGMNVLRMIEGPAVVDAHQSWSPRGRNHVVGAVHHVDVVPQPFESWASRASPRSKSERGGQWNSSRSVGQVGAETHDVGDDSHVAPRQFVDETRRGPGDSRGRTVQRAGVDGDGQHVTSVRP